MPRYQQEGVEGPQNERVYSSRSLPMRSRTHAQTSVTVVVRRSVGLFGRNREISGSEGLAATVEVGRAPVPGERQLGGSKSPPGG